VDGRDILQPSVVDRRGLIMTECSRLEFGDNQCLYSRNSNDSTAQCEAALEAPASEFYLGTSIGINNNDLLNSSSTQFLSQVASFKNPRDVDILFKFRMPQFPASARSDQTADPALADDDSNFFFFHAASVIRGSATSGSHASLSNLTSLPAHDPRIFPRMTISLADYAQEDVLKLQSESENSNSAW
jgi:hypothetical protein